MWTGDKSDKDQRPLAAEYERNVDNTGGCASHGAIPETSQEVSLRQSDQVTHRHEAQPETEQVGCSRNKIRHTSARKRKPG